jgi:tryptophan synthase beta chain
MRDWAATVRDTHYVFGTAAGPHPFPGIVRDLQRVISDEAREQFTAVEGADPDAVAACVGGGSNAIGMFTAFVGLEGVRLYGIEAGGRGDGDGELGTGDLPQSARRLTSPLVIYLNHPSWWDPLVCAVASGLFTPAAGGPRPSPAFRRVS